YDATHDEVVLFGGANENGALRDTWTWDGTTWTQQHPATSPAGRVVMGMAYDAAHGDIVLFGGYNGSDLFDTWTWDGTAWTLQHPATSPSARDSMGMAYDAARGESVLLAGYNGSVGFLGDTWTWDGTTWRVPFVARLHLSPASGPPGTVVQATGS